MLIFYFEEEGVNIHIKTHNNMVNLIIMSISKCMFFKTTRVLDYLQYYYGLTAQFF